MHLYIHTDIIRKRILHISKDERKLVVVHVQTKHDALLIHKLSAVMIVSFLLLLQTQYFVNGNLYIEINQIVLEAYRTKTHY